MGGRTGRSGLAGYRQAIACGATILAALVGFSISGRAAWADPDDIVPRGSIAYDLMGSLAAAGRLPGFTLRDFARGDRLYTRAEFARILAAGKRAAGPTDSYAAAERTLFVLFAPELKRYGVQPFANSAPPDTTGLVTGQLKVRGVTDPTMGEGIVRAASALPVGRDGVLAVSAGNFRREWYPGNAFPGGGSYPLLETAFLRVNGRVLDVTVGASPLRWGPGYSGGMLFSDEAVSVPRVEVEKAFRLPGTVGRRIGGLRYTQFYGQFFEPDNPGAPADATGTRRHLAGRRLETANGGRFSLSVAEAFKASRLPDAFWSFVLPFYSYQNDWTRSSRHRLFGFLARRTEPDTFWLNYMADVGLTYRTKGAHLYADVVLDDLKAPKGLGLGGNTPRKTGMLYGVNLPDLGGTGRYGLRLEYATVDTDTFTYETPANVWARDGRPLGYFSGPNARVFFGRADAAVSDKVRLAAEARIRRRHTTDAENPEPNENRFGLFATYAMRRDLFTGLRIERRTASLPNTPEEKQTRFELNVGAGF